MKERLNSGECMLPLGPDSFYLPICYPKVWRCSLTMREEHRLKSSENRVLRRISGLEMEKVTGDWRNPRNVELIICTSRFLRQSLLLHSQLVTEVGNFFTTKGHDHGTCNCGAVLHSLFAQYPSSRYPAIFVSWSFRWLSFNRFCHRTSLSLRFTSLHILSPPYILSFHYFKHTKLLNEVTGMCNVLITYLIAVSLRNSPSTALKFMYFFIPENKGAHFTSLQDRCEVFYEKYFSGSYLGILKFLFYNTVWTYKWITLTYSTWCLKLCSL